ncbi:MAG TPA: DUF2079 domain-containing protein [Candidatus Tumulicola sp.]|jgi:uncharacterized membrane protein
MHAFTPRRAVTTATIVYAAIFFVLGTARYDTFHSGADLGLFVQTIATAFHGFHNTVEGTSHFAYHFSPILYVLAPPLWIAHSPLVLVAAQAIATALVAVPLYSIARKRTTDWNAAALACIGLLYPPLQGVTFTDFHEVAFVPVAIIALLWAIDARRFGWAATFAAIALASKEDQAIALAFVGIAGAIYFARRNERSATTFCIGLALASVVIFITYFSLVRALAGAPGGWVPQHFYSWSGYTQALPLATQITGRLTYLLEAFVPLALLPFGSRAIVLAIPGFAEVLASREPLTYTMGQHYAAVWIPYVLVAFVIAGARAFSRSQPVGRRWAWTAAALCAIVSIAFSPLHVGHFVRIPNARDAEMHAALGALPADASVGTYDELYSHLGFDPNARIGLRDDPAYIIFDERYSSAYWNGTIVPAIRQATRANQYAVASQRDGIVVLRRTP